VLLWLESQVNGVRHVFVFPFVVRIGVTRRAFVAVSSRPGRSWFMAVRPAGSSEIGGT
jgi:hypothetical protein